MLSGAAHDAGFRGFWANRFLSLLALTAGDLPQVVTFPRSVSSLSQTALGYPPETELESSFARSSWPPRSTGRRWATVAWTRQLPGQDRTATPHAARRSTAWSWDAESRNCGRAGDGSQFRLPRLGVAIPEGHLTVCAGDDIRFPDDTPVQITPEVDQRSLSAAVRFAIHHPFLLMASGQP